MVNIVENLSIFFGIDPWYFYIEQIYAEFGTLFKFSLFGFSLLTLKQFFGTLYHYNRAMRDKGLKASRIPTFFIFVASYIYVLSSVDHKERRFYAPIT